MEQGQRPRGSLQRLCAVLAVPLKHSRREEGCCCQCQGHAREREQQIAGDEDQQTWGAAVPPPPAQREAGERVGGRGRTAKTEGSWKSRGRDGEKGRGWGQPAAGWSGRVERAGLTRLTPRCRERILSCIPAAYFRSFQPFLSREVSHPSALSSIPHPLHTFPCPPTGSISSHAARPTRTAPLVMGIAMAEPVPVSLSPLQPPLHAAAEPGQGSCRHCCRVRFS